MPSRPDVEEDECPGSPSPLDSESLDLSGANLSYVVVVAVIALVALGFAVALRSRCSRADQGTEKMQEHRAGGAGGRVGVPHPAVPTLAGFAVLVFVLLILLPADTAVDPHRPLGLLRRRRRCSPPPSATLGMWLATRANVRVAAAAREPDGAAEAMRIAFRTGGVVGMSSPSASACSAPRSSC